MLVIELNLGTYRFSGEWTGLRRKPLRPARLQARTISWRIPQLRQTPAA